MVELAGPVRSGPQGRPVGPSSDLREVTRRGPLRRARRFNFACGPRYIGS